MIVRAIAAALAALALLPAVALGHAELLETAPGRGEQLDETPRRVTFRFSESVEASFGAVQVFDGEGNRVDDGRLLRPGGARTPSAPPCARAWATAPTPRPTASSPPTAIRSRAARCSWSARAERPAR